MRKISLIGFVMLIVSIPTFAGGLLTNTNQHAAFLPEKAHTYRRKDCNSFCFLYTHGKKTVRDYPKSYLID